jgi:hypothetical protein
VAGASHPKNKAKKEPMSEKYQRTTSYHNGAIRVTADSDGAIITKLSGETPLATVVMTVDQAQEVAQFLQEGLKESSPTAACDICHRDVTELFDLIAGALGKKSIVRVYTSCYDPETDVEAHE